MANTDYSSIAQKYGATYTPAKSAPQSAPQSAPADYLSIAQKYGATYTPAGTSPVSEKRSYEWSDIPEVASKSAKQDLFDVFKGFKEAASDPFGTIHTIAQGIEGGLYNISPEIGKRAIEGMDKIQFFGQDPEATKHAVDVANAIGGQYKENYGSAEAIKRSMAEHPVRTALDVAPLLNAASKALAVPGTMAKSAELAQKSQALSNAAKAVAPVTDLLSNVSSGASTVANLPLIVPVKALEGVGKGVSAATRTVRNALNPMNATYMDIAGQNAPQILNALRAQDQGVIVPGSIPTAAQVASDVPGSARFVAAGEQSAKYAPDLNLAIQQRNRAAQIAAIQNVGKTPEAVKAAEDALTAKTSPMYKAVTSQFVPINQEFIDLMNRPSMQKAWKAAQDYTREKGVPFSSSKGVDDWIVQEAPAAVKPAAGGRVGTTYENIDQLPSNALIKPQPAPGMKGKPVTEEQVTGKTYTYAPSETTVYSGHALDRMKKAIDDLISNTDTLPGDIAALKGTREQFINWLDKNLPGYSEAREATRTGKVPIEQMKIGQQFEKVLVPAHNRETSPLNANEYAAALRDQAETMSKALDSDYYSKLKDVLTPDQLTALENVKKDLNRMAKSREIAATGRQTTPDVGEIMSEQSREIKATNLLNVKAAVVNDVLKRLKAEADPKLAKQFAEEMSSAGTAADALERAMKWKARGNLAAAPFQAVGSTYTKTLRQGPVINALSGVQQQQQNALAPQ